MKPSNAIAAGAAGLILAAAGVCGARLHSGSYIVHFPGTECRELHTVAGAEGRGRFSESGQGYEGVDPDDRMHLFCPLWTVEQLDLGRHRWDWTPGPGVRVIALVDIIDNSDSQNTRCRLHTSDSLDWSGDGYADWEASEWTSTSGTGLSSLVFEASPEQYVMRDGFLALHCQVPPAEGEHGELSTRIAGYRLQVIRPPEDAN
jgi:hypothetical protein